MEYMLLEDGSVKVCNTALMFDHVLDQMHIYDGVAYYWKTVDGSWCRITPMTCGGANFAIAEADVPDVVKLAEMLT